MPPTVSPTTCLIKGFSACKRVLDLVSVAVDQKMAVVGLRLPLFCMLFAFLAALGSAAHSAPAPAVDCSSLVMNMADCLSFVTAGSTTKKPEGTCCSGLKTVLKTGPECLCEAFKNSKQLGVTLNVSKAMTLPAVCHVSAPSVGNCGLSVGTGAAPALPPEAASPTTVAGVPMSSMAPNEAAPAPAPAPAPGSSSSSSLIASIESVVLTSVFHFVVRA